MQSMCIPIPEFRHARVRILDAAGTPFVGADIAFVVNGVHVGAVRASSGEAAIAFPKMDCDMEMIVTADGLVRRVRLDTNTAEHTLTIPKAAPRAYLPHPVAVCPDGQSGQPCVDCIVGDIAVRICG